jgi:hypothetical protein
MLKRNAITKYFVLVITFIATEASAQQQILNDPFLSIPDSVLQSRRAPTEPPARQNSSPSTSAGGIQKPTQEQFSSALDIAIQLSRLGFPPDTKLDFKSRDTRPIQRQVDAFMRSKSIRTRGLFDPQTRDLVQSEWVTANQGAVQKIKNSNGPFSALAGLYRSSCPDGRSIEQVFNNVDRIFEQHMIAIYGNTLYWAPLGSTKFSESPILRTNKTTTVVRGRQYETIIIITYDNFTRKEGEFSFEFYDNKMRIPLNDGRVLGFERCQVPS